MSLRYSLINECMRCTSVLCSSLIILLVIKKIILARAFSFLYLDSISLSTASFIFLSPFMSAGPYPYILAKLSAYASAEFTLSNCSLSFFNNSFIFLRFFFSTPFFVWNKSPTPILLTVVTTSFRNDTNLVPDGFFLNKLSAFFSFFVISFLRSVRYFDNALVSAYVIVINAGSIPWPNSCNRAAVSSAGVSARIIPFVKYTSIFNECVLS